MSDQLWPGDRVVHEQSGMAGEITCTLERMARKVGPFTVRREKVVGVSVQWDDGTTSDRCLLPPSTLRLERAA